MFVSFSVAPAERKKGVEVAGEEANGREREMEKELREKDALETEKSG